MGRGQAKDNGEPLFILVHIKDITGMYTDPDGRVFGADATHPFFAKGMGALSSSMTLPTP